MASIHYFLWGPTGLDLVRTPLPSTPGVDAVAIADVDADGLNDVVAAGEYGRGMVHLGTGAGAFDGGQDLPQIGYQNLATATRVTMAVADLTCDGRPEIVISDQVHSAVMVYRNNPASAVHALHSSAAASAAPTSAAPTSPAPASTPPPPPLADPPTCDAPGTAKFTVGTPGDDVLVGAAGKDVLNGRGGDDCLFGRSGDDRLTGGSGADLLVGSSGDDRMKGDAGEDKLNGGNGNDDITPGAGKDNGLCQRRRRHDLRSRRVPGHHRLRRWRPRQGHR